MFAPTEVSTDLNFTEASRNSNPLLCHPDTVFNSKTGRSHLECEEAGPLASLIYSWSSSSLSSGLTKTLLPQRISETITSSDCLQAEGFQEEAGCSSHPWWYEGWSYPYEIQMWPS